MAEQKKTIVIEGYLVLEPQWGYYSWEQDDDGNPLVTGGRITAVRQNRPTTLRKGGVATKVRFEVDASVFLPLRPEVVIHLHSGNAEVIEVEALDPREEEGADG